MSISKKKPKTIFFLLCISTSLGCYSQEQASDSNRKTVVAGPQYQRSPLHQILWGKHYRKEWNTPVTIPFFYLDTAAGGLKPYQAGGGRQSKTLRLRTEAGKEYVLRSIDKTFGKALPDIYQNTFIEQIINDQVSIAHPYAAVTVAPMAEAAGIYHTWPSIVYLPKQKALDSFNTEFGNDLYLFEQRPDENWEEAANFGYSKNIINTDKLFEKLLEDNDHVVDQPSYVKARLFDMFVGDWGRHEDQWRWASFKTKGSTLYNPIPRDRDQVYTLFDGVLLSLVKSAAGISHLQSFSGNVRDITSYNFPARHLDRRLTNEVNREVWIRTAQELQTHLTDAVISSAVRQMPPEVFPLSGNVIIEKLKSRRDGLVEYAKTYYNFLAKEVEVVGSSKDDHFLISSNDSGHVSILRYDKDNKTGLKKELLYHRTFIPQETNEIRVFGIGGNDTYEVLLNQEPAIIVRLIGGSQEDEYKLKGREVHIYDNSTEQNKIDGKAKLHLSSDTLIHYYSYDGFKYDKRGISPSIFYSRDDRIFAGLSYKIMNHKWRRHPFANMHQFYIRYSFTQQAPSIGYEGIINNFVSGFDLLLNANYDKVRWTNFFGLGNESKESIGNNDYYRTRSEEWNAEIGIVRQIGKQSSVAIVPFFRSIKLLNDKDRYLSKVYLNGTQTNFFDRKNFLGSSLPIQIQQLNNLLLPSKGFALSLTPSYTRNLTNKKQLFNVDGLLQFYLPLSKQFIFSIKNGGAVVTGSPEFYQLNSIGGSKLRGYRRDRYWGEVTYHNNNELQYIFNVKSKIFNGKAGFLAFYDQGRVWLKGERSNAWHYGYGGGIILSPFNKVYVAVVYGRSDDRSNNGTFHLEFRKSLANN